MLNGLRITEVLAARVEDFDTDRGHTVLRIRRKGDKRAKAPLTPATTRALDAVVAGRTTGPVFATATGLAPATALRTATFSRVLVRTRAGSCSQASVNVRPWQSTSAQTKRRRTTNSSIRPATGTPTLRWRVRWCTRRENTPQVVRAASSSTAAERLPLGEAAKPPRLPAPERGVDGDQ